jgi:hemerythrin-like domain-containing protein
MKATEHLTKEHNKIKTLLHIMGAVCDRADAGAAPDLDDLEKMISFIRLYADQYHHAQEEGKLFPAMERAGVARYGGPIGVMLREHELGREFVSGMSGALDRMREDVDDTDARAAFCENARAYATLLTQHIDKEDNVLYPMAAARLSTEAQEELLREFEVFDTLEHAGQDFHALLDRLKLKYL